jgi:hypothetical protein
MAMLNVILVSEEKIKSYTNLNTNLSPAELVSYIWDAQNIMVPNYIGGTYYNALRNRYEAGTINAADEYLLDNYIGPMLCNFGFYYASTFIQYRAYNKGILKGTSENGETMDLEELKFYQSRIKNIAESYAAQMLIYLKTHPEDYPEYLAPNLRDGELPDRKSPYTGGIVLPHQQYARDARFAKYYRGNGTFPGYGDNYFDGPNSI